jgi:tRNA A-37 threonylcarbamoyl transferase component Bud32
MNHFLKSIIDWMLEKEEAMAKECAVPMKEIESQIAKVQEEKVKVQKKCDEAMSELDEVLKRLEKIKSTEILRCELK